MLTTIGARAAEQSAAALGPDDAEGNLNEPASLLLEIDKRREQRDAMFGRSPLEWARESTGASKQRLYEATGLRLGFAMTHVFQAVSETVPDVERRGVASTSDLVASWELLNRGEPTFGRIVTHVQGRWDYGATGPEELGFEGLLSAIGTADTFSDYDPPFILRNMYWRHGSREAGWVYQLGKITPDGITSSSAHLASETTFLPSGGTGPFAIALPDSGLGASFLKYFGDRLAVGVLVSDANADRFNTGDPGEGDLFSAAEVHYKFFRNAPHAGYSKLTLWHTDGTHDGLPANGSAGPSGWGYFLKHEHQLTADGRAVGILRYGKGFNNSALYDEQIGVHLLLFEPRFLTRLKNDLIGTAFNWAKPTIGDARSEYNFEVFYRFPIFPNVDTTLSYQSVFDPAFNPDFDHASVFSLRIRSAF